jgi:hypothetical protein
MKNFFFTIFAFTFFHKRNEGGGGGVRDNGLLCSFSAFLCCRMACYRSSASQLSKVLCLIMQQELKNMPALPPTHERL